MVRISKKGKMKHVSPRRRHYPAAKTGTLKDKLPLGYKEQENSLKDKANHMIFIGKVK